MPIVKLQSSDNVTFDTDLQIAILSGTIKNMSDAFGIENFDNAVVPLSVKSHILNMVLTWLTYHKDDREPTEEEKRSGNISGWDAHFLEVDQPTLFDIMLAAKYLAIPGLYDATCKKVANMIKGKTAEGLRETFNIKCDSSPDE